MRKTGRVAAVAFAVVALGHAFPHTQGAAGVFSHPNRSSTITKEAPQGLNRREPEQAKAGSRVRLVFSLAGTTGVIGPNDVKLTEKPSGNVAGRIGASAVEVRIVNGGGCGLACADETFVGHVGRARLNISVNNGCGGSGMGARLAGHGPGSCLWNGELDGRSISLYIATVSSGHSPLAVRGSWGGEALSLTMQPARQGGNVIVVTGTFGLTGYLRARLQLRGAFGELTGAVLDGSVGGNTLITDLVVIGLTSLELGLAPSPPPES